MIHSTSSAASASRPSLSWRPIAAKKSFTVCKFFSVFISFLRSHARTNDREATALGSDLRHASIDGEIHAGDEGTFLGGEERDGGRDFLGLAPATHRDLRGELGGRLLGLFGGQARRRLQGGGLD